MTRRVRTFIFVAAACVVLAGCGGGGGKGSSSPPPASTAVSGVRVAKIFPVHLTEYKLAPSTIRIERFGYYGIKAINDGSTTHALEITGNGVNAHTPNIKPGEFATMLVFFKKAGTYMLFCPVDGHRAKGMEGTVKVH